MALELCYLCRESHFTCTLLGKLLPMPVGVLHPPVCLAASDKILIALTIITFVTFFKAHSDIFIE